MAFIDPFAASNLEIVTPPGVHASTKLYMKKSDGNWIEPGNMAYSRGLDDTSESMFGRGLFLFGDRYNFIRNMDFSVLSGGFPAHISLLNATNGAASTVQVASNGMRFYDYAINLSAASGLTHGMFFTQPNIVNASEVVRNPSAPSFLPLQNNYYLGILASSNLASVALRTSIMPTGAYTAANWTAAGRSLVGANILGSLTSSLAKFGAITGITENASFPIIAPGIQFTKTVATSAASLTLRIGYHICTGADRKSNNALVGQIETFGSPPNGVATATATGKSTKAIRVKFPLPYQTSNRKTFSFLLNMVHQAIINTNCQDVVDLFAFYTGGLYGAGGTERLKVQMAQGGAYPDRYSFQILANGTTYGEQLIEGGYILAYWVRCTNTQIKTAYGTTLDRATIFPSDVTDCVIFGGDEIFLRRAEIRYDGLVPAINI